MRLESDKYKYWTQNEEKTLEEMVITNKYSFKQIGNILNRTAQSCGDHSRILGFNNKYIRRLYFYDNEFWSIPNPINSYWAGMSSADSNVHNHKNRFTYRMEIKKSDQKHIEELKKNIKYTGPIGKSARIIKFKNKEIHIESVKICINGCKKWLTELSNIWNITPNKTKRLSGPNLSNNYLKFCWLMGYIDGDGYISFNRKFSTLVIGFTSSSLKILEYTKLLIDDNFSNCYLIKKNKNINKLKNANAYVYSVNGLKACVIFDYLHQFPIYRLSRKWEQPHVLEYVNQQKQKYPHFFKTLTIPEKWKNFDLDKFNAQNSLENSENNSKISLVPESSMLK